MKVLVSVIIATYNRCGHLAKSLDDLLNQKSEGSFGFEILVVDNNSKDQTKTVVNERLNRIKGDCLRLRYLFESRQGKSYALNLGIREARGDIIAFIDDDVSVDKKWLSDLVECFRVTGCDGVGGRVLPNYPPPTPQWVKENAVRLSGSVVIYDYGETTRILDKSMHAFIGANSAFKKAVFEECGLFRTDLGPGTEVFCGGEDTEFMERLLAQGKNLYYCGQALVWHPVDLRRLNLRHVARWNIALGKFHAQREKKTGQKFIYYFGAPQYLFRGLVTDFGKLILNVFNKPVFYNAWRCFFRKAGMIQEYWALRNEEKGLRK